MRYFGLLLLLIPLGACSYTTYLSNADEHGSQQQYTIVFSFLTNAPFTAKLNGIFGYIIITNRFHQHHCYLG